MSNNYIYKAEDIFSDIEGDSDNVLMNIPPEICEKMGWKPGDVLLIDVNENNTISIRKKGKNE
jgi:AbrB family looped-hinge helix DNA binding protein